LSRLTPTLIIGATLAAMTLGGTTTAALAQANDDPDSKQAARRPPTQGQVGESWRHRHTGSKEQTAADAALGRMLTRERFSVPNGAPDQVPAPAPTQPNGHHGWPLVSIGALALLMLVGGLGRPGRPAGKPQSAASGLQPNPITTVAGPAAGDPTQTHVQTLGQQGDTRSLLRSLGRQGLRRSARCLPDRQTSLVRPRHLLPSRQPLADAGRSPWWLPTWSSELSDHPGSSRGSPGPAGNLPAGKDLALRAGSLDSSGRNLAGAHLMAAP